MLLLQPETQQTLNGAAETLFTAPARVLGGVPVYSESERKVRNVPTSAHPCPRAIR